MVKVIKAYSLDLKTVQLLEWYVNDSVDAGLMSRSKVVNDAIVWFLGPDNVGELVHANENLRKKFTELMREKHGITESEPISRPWWRRLLLGQ